MRIHFALLLLASWYSPTGHPTAYGKPYDPQALVCAAVSIAIALWRLTMAISPMEHAYRVDTDTH